MGSFLPSSLRTLSALSDPFVFSSLMDQLSETDIVNQLHELNYMVNELVASLSCLTPTHHTLPSITPVDLSFLSFIWKHSIWVENTWVIGVELS